MIKIALKPKAAASPKIKKGYLLGKTIAFTCGLTIEGSVAKRLATTAGAKVTSGVSSKTDILVVGTGAGSKMQKKKCTGAGSKLGKNPNIQYWNEAKFLAAV